MGQNRHLSAELGGRGPEVGVAGPGPEIKHRGFVVGPIGRTSANVLPDGRGVGIAFHQIGNHGLGSSSPTLGGQLGPGVVGHTARREAVGRGALHEGDSDHGEHRDNNDGGDQGNAPLPWMVCEVRLHGAEGGLGSGMRKE